MVNDKIIPFTCLSSCSSPPPGSGASRGSRRGGGRVHDLQGQRKSLRRRLPGRFENAQVFRACVQKHCKVRNGTLLGRVVTMLFAGIARRAGGPLHFDAVRRDGSTGRCIYASLLAPTKVADDGSGTASTADSFASITVLITE